MMWGINIELLLGLFIPPLLYAILIFFTSPYRSVSFSNGLLFMIGGIVSVTILQTTYFLIPSLESNGYNYFSKFFIKIGPLEEFVKYIMFVIIMLFVNKNKVSEHPFRYMFYFSLVGLGFAMIENIGYVKIYGEEVLYIRTFSSTIMHMIFGLLFGYWIDLSTISKKKFENRSVFGVITRRYKKIRTLTYTLIGFMFASIYHGLWNYNLATSDKSTQTIMIILIIFGLLTSKLLTNDLNNQWRNRSFSGER